ncbi:hypothetical protein D3C76_1436240 [compost metagenome]
MALWKPPPVTERLSTSTLAYCLRKPSKLYCAELKLVPTSTTSGRSVSPNSSVLSSLGSVTARVKYSLAYPLPQILPNAWLREPALYRLPSVRVANSLRAIPSKTFDFLSSAASNCAVSSAPCGVQWLSRLKKNLLRTSAGRSNSAVRSGTRIPRLRRRSMVAR